MNHDPKCELGRVFGIGHSCGWEGCWQVGGHCHCGARAYPLCEGCKRGLHLEHTNDPCDCDLCEEEAA